MRSGRSRVPSPSTTLRRLDGERKGEVVRFLLEAGLLDATVDLPPPDAAVSGAVVSLSGADLRGVDLANARIVPSWYNHANVATSADRYAVVVALDGDLRGARFDDATLVNVYFGQGRVDLRDTSFKRTDLWGSVLDAAVLEGVPFNDATLTDVYFGCSNLKRATFDDAEIERGTFAHASLDNASFAGAKFNAGHRPPGSGRGPRRTSFAGASGESVDFSDALNLSSVDLT